MVISKKLLKSFFLGFLLLYIFNSCASDRIDRNNYELKEFIEVTNNPANIDKFNSIIKIHTLNGNVYILNDFNIKDNDKIVSGQGTLQDFNRQEIHSGDFNIPFDSIVIVETNKIKGNSGIIGMAIVTGLSIYQTLYCIANPKACFGSCPTFYTYIDGKEVLEAEGFSSSIAPCLETNDIDCLTLAKPESSEFKIVMKNEALETHVVKYVDLLCVEHKINERVFNSPEGKFFKTDRITPLSAAICYDGDCVEDLSSIDNKERYSLADSEKITNKEEIILKFNDKLDGKKGLILNFRQTLMNTFILYQTLSFMGTNAGSWYAQLERNKNNKNSFFNLNPDGFNEIEVFYQNNENQWVKCGVFNETGPIAKNLQLLPIYENNNKNNTLIKLKMAKGQWRLDYAALANIIECVNPVRIKPCKIQTNKNFSTQENIDLNNYSKPIISLPGDNYFFYFNLPENYKNCDLFIDSKGYYLEWMRQEWLKEENNAMIYDLILDGKGYLDMLTPGFKKIEQSMEQTFWSSRYVKN